MITKLLTANHEDIESLGLSFQNKRSNSGRFLIFERNDNFNCYPLVFGEDGKYDIDESLREKDCTSSDFISGDGSDGVTAETHTEDIFPSAVNTHDDTVETEKETVCEDVVEDVPVTADSRCENSCHAVTDSLPFIELCPQPNQNNCVGNRKKHGRKNKKKKGKKKALNN